MPTSEPERLFSCDTLAARSPSGPPRVVFGKNSDRPSQEAQPLELVPHARHPMGSYVRCQYLTIPQAQETLAVLGSRPWWLWGFEQGVNEAGVAIGNEAIYTRDEASADGLLGMDLVRLGLERGPTAAEASRVIVDLLETYGQGGTAVYAPGFRALYHNSFIVADTRETYVIETSGRHWVWKRTGASVAIANLLTIEDDWTEASEGIEAHARREGWWWGPRGRRFNFRMAFEDGEMRGNTQNRYEASCRYLADGDPASLERMMRHLRDHYEGGTVNILETPENPRPRSICVHPGRYASATAASLVVELDAGQGTPVAWCSMANPCTSIFFPIPVGAALPERMIIGGEIEDESSLWWAMRALGEITDHDPQALTPIVQDVWGEWETEWLAATRAGASQASALLDGRVERVLEKRNALVETLGAAAFAGSDAGPA